MADVEVKLVLRANADGTYTAVVAGAKKDQVELGEAGAKAGKQIREGAEEGKEGIKGLAEQVDETKELLQKLTGIAATAFAVPQIVQMVDSYDNLSSKIRSVTDSEEELNTTRQKVFEIAQLTRQEYEGTADLYSRMARATDELNLSEEKRLKLTEVINKAFVVEGASAQAASAAITQLSQAMEAGAFQGDEFKSVAEQAPIIMDLLAASTGKARGELKEMASQGLLTTDVLVTGLLQGAGMVDERFAAMTPTIAGLVTKLKNVAVEWLGGNAIIAGGVGLLRDGLALLEQNFDLVAGAALVVVGLVGVRLVAAGIAAAHSMVGVALSARAAAVEMGIATAASTTLSTRLLALIGGPIAGYILAIGAAGAAGYLLTDWVIDLGQRGLRSLLGFNDAAEQTQTVLEATAAATAGLRNGTVNVDEFKQSYDKLKPAILDSAAALSQAEEELRAWQAANAALDLDATAQGMEAAQQNVDKLRGGTRELIQAQIDAKAAFDEATAAIERQRVAAEAVDAAIAKVTDVTSRLVDEQTRLETKLLSMQYGEEAGRQAELVKVAAGGVVALLNSNLSTYDRVTKAAKLAFETKDALALTVAVGGLDTKIKGLEATRKREADSTTAGTRAKKDAEDALNRSVDAGVAVWERYRAAVDPLADLAAKHAEELENAATAMAEGKLKAEQLSLILKGQEAELLKVNQALEENTRSQTELNAVKLDGIDRVLGDLQREIDLLEARNAGDLEAIRNLEIQEQIRQRLAQLSEPERAALAADPAKRGAFEDSIERAYELQNEFVFDFGDALGRAVQRAFAEGSVGSGVRQFLSEFKKGLTGGFESALRTINSTLEFASPIIDAFKNSDGNKAGAAMRALNQQLAQLPGIAGAVGQTLGLIDSLTGGKLFGTDWEAQRQGYNVNVGASGVGGNQFTDQTRQRSLFRGTARQTLESDLDQGFTSQLEAFFEGILDVMASAARDVETTAPQMISGTYREVVDKNGKIVEQFSIILGNRVDESFEDFQKRLTAVNIFAVLDEIFRIPGRSSTAPGTGGGGGFEEDGIGGGGRDGFRPLQNKALEATMGEASAIAERWVKDASLYLEGAQMLLLAATDLRNGVGLLGSEGGLTAVADLIESMALQGESLSEAYARVSGATALLEQAVDLMGITLDGSRESFVRAAADIAEAAGGLDRASGLWSRYFETFYSDAERASMALTEAEADRNQQLEALGLSAAISMADLRTQFEAGFPTMTAEQRVQWLEAAEAMAIAQDAQAAYTDILEANASATAEAARIVAEALASYGEASRELQDELADVRGMTEFQRVLRDTARWEAERIRTLSELARAGGMTAAAEMDLVAVHEIAADRIAQAMAKLESRGRSIVEQLYGTELEQIDQQLADLQAAGSSFTGGLSSGIADAQDGSDRLFQSMLTAQQRIRDYLDSMLLGPLGGLRPRDALAEGEAQFQALIDAALGGDADAASQLPQLADTILRLGQQTYASGDEYFELRDWIRGLLGQVANLPVGEPGAGTPVGTVGGSGDPGNGSAIAALQDQRTVLLAEQEAARRRELAMELAGIVREIVTFTQEPLGDIEARLGFTMTELVTDLGVNLQALTVGTASQLADIAQSMGVNLTDLAERVGVDLGDLANRQSLLNAAVKAEIALLPDAQRAQLAPLLTAVEEAALLGDNAALEAAQSALSGAVNALPLAFRDQLAPYFGDVAPVGYDQMTALGSIDAASLATAANTAGILAAMGGGAGLPGSGSTGPGAGVPGYAVGTGYVPNTGLALLHEGEAVLPATVAEFFRREGIPVARIPVPLASGRQTDPSELVAELRALRQERLEADAEMQRMTARIAALEAATQRAGERTAAAIDRQTDAMKRAR